jgi:uncharacterized protein (TIGR02594 family)
MKKICCLLFAFILTTTSTGAVSALTEEGYDYYESNGILWYEKDGGDDQQCSDGSSGNGKNYKGDDILTSKQLEKIAEYQSVYETAANGRFPWQMLAVVHVREHGLAINNPANGQGIFQDLDMSGGPYPPSSEDVSMDEFQRQANNAADELAGKSGDAAALKSGEPDQVKYTFFGYNGRAGVYIEQAKALGFSDAEAANGEGSPYVMNRFDEQRDPTVEPTKSNGTWGQIKVDHGPIEYPANSDAGAYTQYTAITDCPAGNATLEAVVNIAEEEAAKWAANPSWGEAQSTMYDNSPGTAWCAQFVSWVYMKAGIKLGSNGKTYYPAVDSWLNLSSVKSSNVKLEWHAVGDSYTPRAGDVIVYKKGGSSHVNIYIGKSESAGRNKTVGGNESNRVQKSDYSTGNISGYVTIAGTK